MGNGPAISISGLAARLCRTNRQRADDGDADGAAGARASQPIAPVAAQGRRASLAAHEAPAGPPAGTGVARTDLPAPGPMQLSLAGPRTYRATEPLGHGQVGRIEILKAPAIPGNSWMNPSEAALVARKARSRQMGPGLLTQHIKALGNRRAADFYLVPGATVRLSDEPRDFITPSHCASLIGTIANDLTSGDNALAAFKFARVVVARLRSDRQYLPTAEQQWMTAQEFTSFYGPIHKMRGATADELDAAADQIAQAVNARADCTNRMIRLSGTVGEALQRLSDYEPRTGSAEGATAPAVRALLEQIKEHGSLPSITAAEDLFVALRSDPTHADAALACAQQLIADHSTGEVIDQIGGAWQVACAILLNLPESVLREMTFPHVFVELLREEAMLLLGTVHCIGSRHPQGNVGDMPERLPREAALAMNDPRGRAFALRLGRALQILDHNAERLRRFIDMDVDMGVELADLQRAGRTPPLIALLDHFVPEPLPPAGSIAFAAQVLAIEHVAQPQVMPAEPGSPTVVEQAPASTVPDAEPLRVHVPRRRKPQNQPTAVPPQEPASQPQAKPQAEPQSGPRTKGASLPPKGVPVRPGKQAGSSPDNPAMHNHPGEHRTEKKHLVKLRKAWHQLVQKGMVHPFAPCTPEVLERYRDMKREGQLERDGLSAADRARGQQLVTKDPINLREAKR